MKNPIRRHQHVNVIENLEPRGYFSVDLTASVSFAATAVGQLKPGKSATIAVEVTNDGTTLAAGKLAISLGISASSDGAGPIDLATILKGIHLKPGADLIFRIAKKIPVGSEPGTYYAVTDVDPNNVFSDTNLANNTAISTDTLSVLDPYQNIVGTWTGTIKITHGVDKGLVVATLVDITGENPTNGDLTGTGANYFTDGITTYRAGTGTLNTNGTIADTGTDLPVDSTGVYHNKGKIVGDVWKGTYTNAINSGTFVLTYQG